jgi:hypothetical protein
VSIVKGVLDLGVCFGCGIEYENLEEGDGYIEGKCIEGEGEDFEIVETEGIEDFIVCFVCGFECENLEERDGYIEE